MKKKYDIVILNNDYTYANPFENFARISYSLQSIIPSQTDLVLFTGGADVHPMFYKGKNCGISYTNLARDGKERNIFNYCRKHDIKMAGICRGFQFLNVMSGGFMYQHIDNHGGIWHHVDFHNANFIVTSTHHQLVGLCEKAIPMAWSSEKRSCRYIGPQGDMVAGPKKEIESAIFPEINAMGVQYHPEMMNTTDTGYKHYELMMQDFIRLDMDDFVKKYTNYVGGKAIWQGKIRTMMQRKSLSKLFQKSR